MPSILLIEDEADLQHVLEYNLKQAGYEVYSALRGKDGLRLAAQHQPSLVLLDLMLPDLPGTQVCRALKSDPRTAAIPIIMLTARGEETDRIVGFELGADDYVVKPFSVRELLLRLNAILRRGRAPEVKPPSPGPPAAEDAIEFGRLRIEPQAHRVFVDGEEVRLTALELKLLLRLYEAKNRVQTRAMLLDDVWDIEAEITTRTVDTHVKRLREKLGGAGRYIETVRGVGYRFAEQPVEQPAGQSETLAEEGA
jgi:two-component system phosphate regulon response regulator PhoB